jgi:hypothetical protein
VLNDAEHFGIAHAAETLDEVAFGDRIAAGVSTWAWARLMIGSLSTSTPSQSKITKSKRMAIIRIVRALAA